MRKLAFFAPLAATLAVAAMAGCAVVGGDVVEVAPQYDPSHNTAHVAAQMHAMQQAQAAAGAAAAAGLAALGGIASRFITDVSRLEPEDLPPPGLLPPLWPLQAW